MGYLFCGRRSFPGRLATDLDLDRLDALTTELSFDELPAAGPRILAGEIRGRCVVPIGA